MTNIYIGFPTFATMDNLLNVHDYLCTPIPIQKLESEFHQLFQRGFLHTVKYSDVMVVCPPEMRLYDTVKGMEIFRIAQDTAVLYKFRTAIPILRLLRGPKRYILVMGNFFLALEKGSSLVLKWLLLNVRYVEWLKVARPKFSGNYGLYIPI